MYILQMGVTFGDLVVGGLVSSVLRRSKTRAFLTFIVSVSKRLWTVNEVTFRYVVLFAPKVLRVRGI